MTDRRVVMKRGGMDKVVGTSEAEKSLSIKLNKIDEFMLSLRDKVRHGEVIEDVEMGDLGL
jgi:hypothetical protein